MSVLSCELSRSTSPAKSDGIRRGLRSRFAAAAITAAVAAFPSCLYATPVNLELNDTLYVANNDGVVQYSGNTNPSVQSNYGSNTSTLATGANTSYGLAFDSSGNLYVACYSNSEIYEIPASNPTTAIAWSSAVTNPVGLTYYDGSLYAASYSNGGVYKISTGGPSSTASLYATISDDSYGLVADSSGNLYAGNGSSIIKIAAPVGINAPVVTGNWATGGSTVKGLAIDGNNDIFAVNAGGTGFISELVAQNGVATGGINALTTDEVVTGLGTGIVGVAVDPEGNVFTNPGAQGSQTIDLVSGTTQTVYESSTGQNTRFMLFAPVPEPASLSILGLSSLALLRRRRSSGKSR